MRPLVRWICLLWLLLHLLVLILWKLIGILLRWIHLRSLLTHRRILILLVFHLKYLYILLNFNPSFMVVSIIAMERFTVIKTITKKVSLKVIRTIIIRGWIIIKINYNFDPIIIQEVIIEVRAFIINSFTFIYLDYFVIEKTIILIIIIIIN